jgi:hypothetical protein
MLPIADHGIHHPGTRSHRLNFGRLQIATLWRLSKNGVERHAAVLDSPKGPRLVIIEHDRIIQWETFKLTRELRGRAVQIRRELRKSGWVNAD